MKTPAALNPRAADCLAVFQQRTMQIMRSSSNPENSTLNQRTAPDNKIRHFPTSHERTEALDLVKWVFAVAKLPADSPRFAWYVSRWDVPNKIARAKADGTFNDITADCPPIDPAWCRFVPAALEAHRQFIASTTRPKADNAKSSGKLARFAQLIFTIGAAATIVIDL